MKLPTFGQVRIDDRKIRDYLLSSSHPIGQFKARYFARLGFGPEATGPFVAELRRIAAEGEVSSIEDTDFGTKYTVPGELRGALASAAVLTVWFQDAGESDVRLVTVRPR